MCKASITAERVRDATVGERYKIGTSDHNLGAFHPVDESPRDCVVCAANGAVLTLTNVPADLQQKFDIGAETTAEFVDTGDNSHDELRFDNGLSAVLVEFADRDVLVEIGYGEPASGEQAPAAHEPALASS